MSRYRVLHETTYHYCARVVTSHNEARLRPRQLARQAVWESLLEIHPAPDTVSWRKDYFGNDVVHFDLERPHGELRLVASSTIDVRSLGAAPVDAGPPWARLASSVRAGASAADLAAFEFVLDSAMVRSSPELEAYARASFSPGRSVLEGALELASRIFRDFEYDEAATHVATPIADVLKSRRGVCQDFAHLMIGCLRSLGVPARYVSGYVLPERGVGARGSDVQLTGMVGGHASHAWVAAYCGELGWVEIDPTNDVLVSEEHIVLGWGRDYDDVSPVRGVTVGGSNSTVAVKVTVQPVS